MGAGVIGAGWAARFAAHGWHVAVWDPHPDTEVRVRRIVNTARRHLAQLYDAPLPDTGRLEFCDDPADAVSSADWVAESLPEELPLKRELYRTLHGLLPAGVPLASSTSGFRPSQLAEGCLLQGQLLVCHPFNPVYLLPGVEVVPGAATEPEVAGRATELLRSVGMLPVLVRREIDAHIADRLLEAIWREALWLVKDGIATTGEIDQIMRDSFGLRWAQMGLFETYRLGGGEGGFRHFLRQFGPALQWPWSRLTDVPELDDALIDIIVAQSDAQAAGESVGRMAERRDRNLVALMRGLKSVDDGAGAGLNAYERDVLQR